ncbi:MAG: hypothetical protein ABFD90_15585 [Phycisphaerales bacterium]
MRRRCQRISKHGVVLCLGLGLAVLGMCGCGKSAMDFSYEPLAAVDTLCMEEDSCRLLCVSFLDERESEKAGGAKNLYGMTLSAFVFEREDMVQAFTAAVTDTLRKAGYKVAMSSERITGQDIPAGELQGFDYVVGGKIQKISASTKPGWSNVNAEAAVEISMYVRKIADGPEGEWFGPLSGESLKQSYAVMDVSQAAERSLNMAMQDCMVNLVRHLKASGTIVAK